MWAVGLQTGAHWAWAGVGACGAAFSLGAALDAVRRRRLGVDVIALLALVGALSVGEYLAGAVVALMLASGRVLEAWAGARASDDLSALVARAPRSAHRYETGGLVDVAVGLVAPGDRLLDRPGEVVPVDGRAVGPAVLDESALTGEAVPCELAPGADVPSGVVNAGGSFDMVATAGADQSTYAALVRMVRQAQSSRPPMVRLADRLALWFLAFTLVLAGGAWAMAGPGRAVAVLVVATPCPLILATPVAIVAGLSRAARRGVVVKDGEALERLAAARALLVDKTGTVTKGKPVVSHVATAEHMTRSQVLALAGSLEQASVHVLARAIVLAARQAGQVLVVPEAFTEVPGQGAHGLVGGHAVSVGNADLVGVPVPPDWASRELAASARAGSTAVFVSVDGALAGLVVLDDPIRPEAPRTVRSLRRLGVEKVLVVSGDRPEPARAIGALIGADEVLSRCSPSCKLEVVRSQSAALPTVMVGDGVNDAPALALADVGVAMGAAGATASSQAADVVVLVDRFDRVAEARGIALRTRHVAAQSALAGLGMSLAAMGVATYGALPAVWGALLQEAIDVAVILNALRALRPQHGARAASSADSTVLEQFRTEHTEVEEAIAEVRAVADSLGRLPAGRAIEQVRRVHADLAERVKPHELAEESVLYPVVRRMLGGEDPTGPMSRAHAEICRRIDALGELLGGLGQRAPEAQEVDELRAMLYGLHAILSLHTAQEEESYLSRADELPA